jgi:elongation factor 2
MVRVKNVDQVAKIIQDPNRIRNISIIAQVDHGKSTLTDSLVSRAGIISQREAGDKTFTDNRDDEKERGITIKSTAVSLPMSWPRDAKTEEETEFYLVNLIDCPGHVDFSGEVTAALRLTDGAVVVVDCVEGVCIQTEVVLRQALAERIRPVLFLNKVDRMFMELGTDLEDVYQTFCRTIESVNAHIALFQDDAESSSELNFSVDPLQNSVAFGSGLYGWGFTLDTFAEIYSKNTGVSKEKWLTRLWGEKFYNTITKKWSNSYAPNSNQVRGFCEFILKPIRKVLHELHAGKTEAVLNKLKTNGISFDAGFEKDVSSMTAKRDIVRAIMSNWIPVSESMLSMIISKLPSPVIAQKYRAETLYAGPLDDVCAADISLCNEKGVVMAYVAKMRPNEDGTRFIGVCRIYSGSISRADKLRVLSGSAEDTNVTIQRVSILVGAQTLTLDYAPCGMIVGLSGLEKSLVRSGTLTSDSEAHPFKGMNFSVAAVVRRAVSVANPKDSKKLVEGLRKLERTDQLVQVFIDEKTDECIIAGAGELHLEVCLGDLSRLMDGVEIIASNPIVPFVETITQSSDFVCLTKSANKLNHLMAKVVKLEEDVVTQLDKFESKEQLSGKDFELKKLWAISGGNLLVDGTKGVQGLSSIKQSIVKSFEEFHGGVLCDEPIRGMRVDLVDCKIHSDNAHRGFNQIAPASKALFQACQMAGKPVLMEPMYEVSIRVPRSQISGVYVCLAKRKAEVLKTDEVGSNGLMFNITAHLAVRESFGFTEALRADTSGQAFPQLNFSHWKIVDGNPLEEGSVANKLVQEVRKRKGLSDKLPALEDFHTKL